MEETPFNLDRAIADWRNALKHKGIAPETIEELEGHLAESTKSLQASGLSAREAFKTAVDRLGDPDEFSSNAPDRARSSGSGCIRALGMAIVISGVTFFLGAIALSTLFFLVPVQYSSQVTLQVGPPDPSTNFNTFQQTQFAIIESRKNIEDVVSRLDLIQRWNLTEESSYQRLKKNLRTEGVRGTDLIQISVIDQDPALAAQIANALAHSYQDRMESAAKLPLQSGELPRRRVVIHELAAEDVTPARKRLFPSIIAGVLGVVFLFVGIAIRRS